MYRILYLAMIGYKNLGDELMWHLFKDNTRKLLDDAKIDVIPSYNIQNRIKKLKHYDLVVLGGGSIINSYFINLLYKAMKLNKRIIIWGSGMDRIPEEKMKLLTDGSFINLNKLYNPKLQKRMIEVLHYADYVGVRGPLTYKMLEQIGVNPKEISGDSGLLVDNLTCDTTYDIKYFDKGEKVIGVNWGTSFNKIYGKNELNVENQLVNAIKQLIKKGYKIYIYNVWDKDIPANRKLYEKVGDNKNVILDENLYHNCEKQLLEIIKGLYFTINFKLHATVMSAGAKVPFISLGYRFKIFDFASSLQLENMVISTSSNQIVEDILRLENYIKWNRHDILQKINAGRKRYEPKLLNVYNHINTLQEEKSMMNNQLKRR